MQIIANSTKQMQPELAANIVTCQSGVPVTTSLAIAEGVGNTHKTVIQLIRKNFDDLQEFGSLAFEMRVIKADGRGGQQALVEHKVTEVEHSSGLCKVSTQVRITMKGLAKLSGSMLNG